MKKALAILMTLLMLCSMVVFVSAADKTYEGKGFTIEVPDGYTFDDYSDSGDIYYFITDGNAEIEISATKIDDAKAEFELIAEGNEVTTFADRPAIIGYGDDNNCVIVTYTDKYIYSIDCEGDAESAKSALEIAKTIKFTDASADDDAIDTIGSEDSGSEFPWTIVIIASAAVLLCAIALVAVVVVIIIAKKKKK